MAGSHKILVFNDNVYKKYQSGTWNVVTTSNPAENDYLAQGMTPSEIEDMSEEAWGALTGIVELCYYTDDPTKTEAQFEIDTDDFRLHDEFDNQVDVLYLTNKEGVTESTLDITANHTPLDEVYEDFDLVVWKSDDPHQLSMSVTGIPHPKHRHKVEISDPQRTIKDWTDWTESNLLESVSITPSMFNTINPSTLTVTVEQLDGKTVTATGIVSIFDTEPIIFATYLGNTLNVRIGDDENDKIQFKILLNGKQIHPSDGFTALSPPPAEYSRTFYSHEIKINQQNTLEIISKDEYGKESRASLSFLGDYTGIMFMDSVGKYFSDSLGNVLQYLDFGSILAGRTTLPKRVRLINKNVFPIKNLKLTMETGYQSNTRVEISKTESPFVPETTLSFSSGLEANAESEFYVRIATHKDDPPHSGTFDIIANAEPL